MACRVRLRPIHLPLIIVLCFAAFSAVRGYAAAAPQASAEAPHLTVSLVVPPAALYPGESFTGGLDFKLESGWHVYWVNAGDSGEPPAITWKLPPGISAGALQFPAPKRLPLGPLMDFGYEDEV